MKESRLILTLLRKGQSFEIKKEDRKRFVVIGIIITLFVMIPVCIAAGFITYAMTLAFIEKGGRTEGMLFVVLFLSAFAFVFGFAVIMNEFYFTSDIDFLLPLPVKTGSVVTAKFINTYIAETGMELFVIISAYAGYITAAGFKGFELFKAVTALFLMPAVPLAYCGILCFLMIRFVSVFRSRGALRVFMTLLSIGMMALAMYSFGGLKGLSVDNFIETLLAGDNRFINLMSILFYPCTLLVRAKGGAELAFGILLTLLLAVLFLLLAGTVYEEGLNSIRSAGNKKETRKTAELDFARRSPAVSLFAKELKILLRTPAFLSNCIIINIFWPALMFIVALMLKSNNTIPRYTFYYHKGYYLAHLTVMVIMLGMAAVTAAGSGLASSAVTREGSHAGFMKYIPVSYRTQLSIKVSLSIIFCGLSYLFDVIIIRRSFSLDFTDTLYYLLLGFLMIVFITMLGIMKDIRHPKLIWENESNALRANFNVFMNMAEAIISVLFFALLGAALYNMKIMTIPRIKAVYMLVMASLTAYAVIFYKKTVVREMERLEI